MKLLIGQTEIPVEMARLIIDFGSKKGELVVRPRYSFASSEARLDLMKLCDENAIETRRLCSQCVEKVLTVKLISSSEDEIEAQRNLDMTMIFHVKGVSSISGHVITFELEKEKVT